jgi:small subunit ribosomal protein S10|tara:strand:- start:245 stop:550 length:306 start_codon:yes stop_codon:yes gene_type:complete
MNLKYQIKIKSLHKESVKLYINFLQKMLRKIKVNFSIIALPEKKNRVTLLKSPHVNKSAREQFEIRYYRTLLKIKSDIDHKTLELLLINKPKSVTVSVKAY